jgi:hypothetical protein
MQKDVYLAEIGQPVGLTVAEFRATPTSGSPSYLKPASLGSELNGACISLFRAKHFERPPTQLGAVGGDAHSVT